MLHSKSKIIDYHMNIMRYLGGNNDSSELKIQHFLDSYNLFSGHFAPKGVNLELVNNGTPLFPAPFASTGDNPSLIVLGINPGLNEEHVAVEKSFAGDTYSKYAESYCHGDVLIYVSLTQKSRYFTHKILPIAISLKYKKHRLYSDFKAGKDEFAAFVELIKGFDFMTVEAVPYHSKKFYDTGTTSIMHEKFFQKYTELLFSTIENRIRDRGTLFLFYTPKQFADVNHLVSIYREEYMPKLKNIKNHEKYILANLELNYKKIMLIVCKYAEQTGVNTSEEKNAFWSDVFSYINKYLG